MIFHRRQGPRMPEAEAMLKKAITLDPRFARAWARMASLRAIARNYTAVNQATAGAGIEEAAHAAIAIDPRLAEPHAALASHYGALRDYARQRDAFAQALALDPDDIIANLWNGTSLASSGYRTRAYVSFDHALELDPLLPIALLWRGTGHVTEGEVEIGEKQLRLAEESGLAFAGLGLGQLAASRGDVDTATAKFTAAFQALASDVPAPTIAVFARACAGDPTARAPALALVDEVLAAHPDVVPAIAPYVLFSLGESDRAFDLVAPAPTSNDALVFGSFHRGVFPGARTSPRVPEFARQVGWAALWDAEGPPDDCSRQGADWVCIK
jgi:tetratricopeptide (TPR) repeat protein